MGGGDVMTAVMPTLMVTLWSSAGVGPLAFPLIITLVPLITVGLMAIVRRRYNHAAKNEVVTEMCEFTPDM